MVTLRTPKYLTGPDGGIPNLTIRAWYEAQHGPGAWEKLELIPKEMWADYLAFFRRVCEIPVRNLTRAGAIEWRADDDCFAIPTFAVTPDEHRDGDSTKTIRATVIPKRAFRPRPTAPFKIGFTRAPSCWRPESKGRARGKLRR